MKALLFLSWRQIINYARLTLRSPRRLIPAVVGVAGFLLWLQFFFLRHRPMQPPPTPEIGVHPEIAAILWPFAFVVAAIVGVYLILRSFGSSLIVFNPPDIDFVLASPIRPGILAAVKLIRLYSGIGLFLAYMIFIMAHNEGRGSTFVMVLMAVWAAVVLYGVMLVNASTALHLTATRRGGTQWRVARGIRLAVLVIGLVAIASVMYQYRQTGSLLDAFVHGVNSPILYMPLFPAAWLADIAVSPIGGWKPVLGVKIAGFAGLVIASYVWVLTRREAAYEPSLQFSAWVRKMKTSLTNKGKPDERPKPTLRRTSGLRSMVPPFGRGATSIVWKNLIVGSRQSLGFLIGAIVIAGLLAAVPRIVMVVANVPSPSLPPTGGVALFLFFPALFMIPIAMMETFRKDIRQIDLLKPMPITPWKVMAAEAANMPIGFTIYAFIVAGWAIVLYGLPPGDPVIYLTLAMPFVVYSSSCLQLSLAVLYPDSADPMQKMLSGIFSFIASAISIGSAIIIGGLIWYLHIWMGLAVIGIALISLALSVAGVAVGAYAYRLHDPTNE